MNIYISVLIILVSLFFIISATTANVEKDRAFNLSCFQTYKWVKTTSVSDPSSRSFAETDHRILHSVDKELSKWGWRQTDRQPDILVSYDVLVNKIKEREQEGGITYTDSFTRFYYNEDCARWSPIDYPSHFVGYDVYDPREDKPTNNIPIDKATLTITLVEAGTDKKVWQGWITEKLPSRKLTEKEIERSINAIFRKT